LARTISGFSTSKAWVKNNREAGVSGAAQCWEELPLLPGMSRSTGTGEGLRAARGEPSRRPESGRQFYESKVIAA
jgi:hypothetical protein